MEKLDSYANGQLPSRYDILTIKADTPFIRKFSGVIFIVVTFLFYVLLLKFTSKSGALLAVAVVVFIYIYIFHRETNKTGWIEFDNEKLLIQNKTSIIEIEFKQVRKLIVEIGARNKFGIISLNLEIIPNEGSIVKHHISHLAIEIQKPNVFHRTPPSLSETLTGIEKNKLCLIQYNYQR